ncbi:hypothetical protein SH661x_000702 [Planctomicrobium sp. SH661]|uniref:hypothetical protein n=1 Tax=Planctomicrobium sp. SH661 TaxID=3448124 RepID=UPI003F5C1F84
MKNLPTLTIALFLLGLGGFQVASAWQAKPEQAESEADDSTESVNVESLTKNDPEAVALVQQARNKLFERQSVQAEMAEIVTLGTDTFRSTGSYASATGFRYRLEYQVELADLQGNFLEVCDGQVLHTRRQISEVKPALTSTVAPQVELSRRDIQKIRREAMVIKDSTQGEALADALRAAEVGIGGLPAVLASLERSMIFAAVRPETVEGREFLVVQGHWKADRRERLFAGLGAAGGQMAGFMPDLVRIYIARDTLFPEKFLYLKKASKDSKTYRPLVAVEFRNVVLDQPIPERMFVYVAPPGVEEKDDTAAFLEGMRQTVEPSAAK